MYKTALAANSNIYFYHSILSGKHLFNWFVAFFCVHIQWLKTQLTIVTCFSHKSCLFTGKLLQPHSCWKHGILLIYLTCFAHMQCTKFTFYFVKCLFALNSSTWEKTFPVTLCKVLLFISIIIWNMYKCCQLKLLLFTPAIFLFICFFIYFVCVHKLNDL